MDMHTLVRSRSGATWSVQPGDQLEVAPTMTSDATAAADQSPWVTSYGCVLRLVHRTLQGTTVSLIW